MITVIYCIRDREPQRLENSVESIRRNTLIKDISFIAVDYGSSSKYQSQIIEICEDLNIKYVRVETEGLPWSRAHALNIGVIDSNTEFIAITDIDMIANKDILSESLKKCKEGTIVHCQSRLLPRSGIYKFGKWGDKSQLGGYLFVRRNDFLKVNGFDEGIKFWGHEDFDLEQRLYAYGFKAIWLDFGFLSHIWHPLSNSFLADRPESSWNDTLNISLRNAVYPREKNKRIGINIVDRPILRFREKIDKNIYKIKKYEKEISDMINIATKKKFLTLQFPERRVKKVFINSILDSFFLLLNKAILSRLGYSISIQKDNNFDLFYMSIPLLEENGLIDYYIYDDFERVDILFK